MEGDPTFKQWSHDNFSQANLGDTRRTDRLVELAAAMHAQPEASLPQQCAGKAELAGTYRLLSNPVVDAQAIQQPHRERVARQASELPVVLCVQDTTQLDFSKRAKRGSIKGTGPLGTRDGHGHGLMQHAALAVTEEGQTLGVLDQRWHCQHRPEPGETRKQRRDRDTEAHVWARCAHAVAALPTGKARVIHVGDRHSDVFGFLLTTTQLDHGYTVRAMHNRYVDGDETKLFEKLADQPVADTATIHVPRRSGGPSQKRRARDAELSLRYCKVALQPPRNDPRYSEPIHCYTIELVELDPPEDADPIRWVLLCSERVESRGAAWRVVTWYRRRWVIEEWHRQLKEGCRVEKAQLDDAADIKRLAAIAGPIAADLLQLRDLASSPEHADSTQVLQQFLPWSMIAVAAALCKVKPEDITPRQFFAKVAQLGGYLGRKNDPRPGAKALWHGWQQIATRAQGWQLAQDAADV